jgi:hypothetical protein
VSREQAGAAPGTVPGLQRRSDPCSLRPYPRGPRVRECRPCAEDAELERPWPRHDRHHGKDPGPAPRSHGDLPRWGARERQTAQTRSATMVHAGWGRRRFLLATSAALATKGRTIIARAQTRRGEIVAGLSEREISPWRSTPSATGCGAPRRAGTITRSPTTSASPERARDVRDAPGRIGRLSSRRGPIIRRCPGSVRSGRDGEAGPARDRG